MDPPIQIPVGFYVIKHPKGNILFDTGNNDKHDQRSELLGCRVHSVEARR